MEHNNALINIAKTTGGIDKETLKTFAVLISPFAPHIGEEVWSMLGGTGSVFSAGWPEYDDEMTKEDTIEIPVQVNGKVKCTVEAAVDADRDTVMELARKAVANRINGTIVKEIYVPGKILNFVVK